MGYAPASSFPPSLQRLVFIFQHAELLALHKPRGGADVLKKKDAVQMIGFVLGEFFAPIDISVNSTPLMRPWASKPTA